MNLIEFLLGILILFFGVIPWIGTLGGIADKLGTFANPGQPQYQIAISVLGLLLVIVSLAGKKKSSK
jgi:hypothetical protein